MDDLVQVFWKETWYFRINLVLIFFIILFFSLLIADPHLKNASKKVNKKWIDIAIVLDLSLSMKAEDMFPTRLEVAKKVIADFTSKLTADRVWLIVFSGKPFVSVPLTFDYQFITNYVKNISMNTINQNYNHLQWTAIWDALLYGENLFWDDEREKVIVLLTDGEANRGVDPILALRYVKEKWIKVHTVGIAGDKETFITIENGSEITKMAIWWIDESSLQAIAELTGWEYYRARDNKTFELIFEKLNLLQKKDIEVEEIVWYQNLYFPLFIIIFSLIYTLLWYNFYFYLKD